MEKKWSDMFVVCVWMIFILVTCALLMDGITGTHRAVLLVAAATVGVVFIICESRVERARTPLILRDETAAEHSHPPESADE